MMWNSEKYENSSPIQLKIGQRAIDVLNPREPEKILDIGCGTGILDLEIAKRLGSENTTGVVTNKITIDEIETLILQKFFMEGQLAAIVPPAEIQAYNADMTNHLTNNIPRRKDLQRRIEKAGFHDIQIDGQTIRHEFDTLDGFLDNREVASWLSFLSTLPEKYRDKVCLHVREKIREEWGKIPDEQKILPLQEQWPVAFIHAKKE